MKIQHIHILAARAFRPQEVSDITGDFAVISCAERTNGHIGLCRESFLLLLHFDDTVNENDLRCFSRADAAKIRVFLESLPDTVSDLFVLCDSGESRSTAIASAILLYSGRRDTPVWDNPFYHPNLLVFGRLCRELGIGVSETELREKQKRSEDAFANAVKNGTDHKRWEIIKL